MGKQPMTHATHHRFRLRCCAQQLIQFGILTPDQAWRHVMEIPSDEPCVVPEYLANLPPISLLQLAFSDEWHRKVNTGSRGRRQVRFPRDEKGRIDPDGARAELLGELKAKFSKESRFSFVCKLGGGAAFGTPFDYTGKWIVSIADWKKLEEAAIAKVRQEGKRSKWVTETRRVGELYLQDSVTLVKGVADATSAHLADAGVHTVADLLGTADDFEIPGFKRAGGMRTLKMNCKDAQDGEFPDERVVDHRKVEGKNPYESRFGSDWKLEIAKSSQCNGSVCITSLVEWLVNETLTLFKGTEWEDTCLFVHDALPLMTSKACIEWMKETKTPCGRTYFSMWLLPVKEILDQFPSYRGPPGNSPEFMPWDSSLNKDVIDCLLKHAIMTRHLPDTDPRKFSISDHNKQSACVKRLMDTKLQGCPSPRRIQQDCCKYLAALLAVYQARGTIVLGLGERGGHRQARGSTGGWGGRRPRTAQPFKGTEFYHPSVQGLRRESIQHALALTGSDLILPKSSEEKAIDDLAWAERAAEEAVEAAAVEATLEQDGEPEAQDCQIQCDDCLKWRLYTRDQSDLEPVVTCSQLQLDCDEPCYHCEFNPCICICFGCGWHRCRKLQKCHDI